jgi:hypothetical protein
MHTKLGMSVSAALLATGCASTGNHSVEFAGVVKHAKPTPKTNEGNMHYLAYAQDYKHNAWNFENGIGTYKDSYHQQSFMLFSNVSHDKVKTKYLQPTIGLNCTYKGTSHNNDKMKVVCSPPIKFRIGEHKGFFAYITPVPKIKGLTNGLVSKEVGYKF